MDASLILLCILAVLGVVGVFSAAAVAVFVVSLRHALSADFNESAALHRAASEPVRHGEPVPSSAGELAQGDSRPLSGPAPISATAAPAGTAFSIPKSVRRREKCRICLFLKPFFLRGKRGE